MAEPQGNDPSEVVREVEVSQMPHELNLLYNWVTQDVLGSPSTLTEEYVAKLKCSGVICGGGEEKRLYLVELPRRGERVCELNLEHPRVPHWLWVKEVMFTKFGVWIPFSPFQQRLLQRYFVAPSQFHPNVWLAIQCFELVTEFLELPQDPEVFLYLFTVFSPNAEGKSKKRYMSVRPGKYWRIFGDASRFPSYWSKDAELNYTPLPLKPKAVLENPERTRMVIGIETSFLFVLALSSVPERGSSSNVREWTGTRIEVLSLIREEEPEPQIEVPPLSPLGKRGPEETTSVQKRPRVSEGMQREFCSMDRSFDTTGFIESNLLGPCAREALHDYDRMESPRWTQWAVLRSATTMKSIDPRLTMADQWEGWCTNLAGDLKLLSQQKAKVEKEKLEADVGKSNAKKELELVLANLKLLEKEKDVEVQRLKDREADLLAELEVVKKKHSEEKSRANKAEVSLVIKEQAHQELITMESDFVKATEENLKAQILLLAPDFDVSLLGAWKEIVDGKIVDPTD
ncbi:hypothetical protein PIB30_005815 [Stylosanthes scabra]|uniref:Transposase (putative) gypsy type domain-containing protein n=1 Tax=Stylosanthes scabra TaxID=79078 RepID=A0ABU6Y2X1_9FABA|nr:hypothetical protein [Stylosanthes scabra]